MVHTVAVLTTALAPTILRIQFWQSSESRFHHRPCSAILLIQFWQSSESHFHHRPCSHDSPYPVLTVIGISFSPPSLLRDSPYPVLTVIGISFSPPSLLPRFSVSSSDSHRNLVFTTVLAPMILLIQFWQSSESRFHHRPCSHYSPYPVLTVIGISLSPPSLLPRFSLSSSDSHRNLVFTTVLAPTILRIQFWQSSKSRFHHRPCSLDSPYPVLLLHLKC